MGDSAALPAGLPALDPAGLDLPDLPELLGLPDLAGLLCMSPLEAWPGPASPPEESPELPDPPGSPDFAGVLWTTPQEGAAPPPGSEEYRLDDPPDFVGFAWTRPEAAWEEEPSDGAPALPARPPSPDVAGFWCTSPQEAAWPEEPGPGEFACTSPLAAWPEAATPNGGAEEAVGRKRRKARQAAQAPAKKRGGASSSKPARLPGGAAGRMRRQPGPASAGAAAPCAPASAGVAAPCAPARRPGGTAASGSERAREILLFARRTGIANCVSDFRGRGLVSESPIQDVRARGLWRCTQAGHWTFASITSLRALPAGALCSACRLVAGESQGAPAPAVERRQPAAEESPPTLSAGARTFAGLEPEDTRRAAYLLLGAQGVLARYPGYVYVGQGAGGVIWRCPEGHEQATRRNILAGGRLTSPPRCCTCTPYTRESHAEHYRSLGVAPLDGLLTRWACRAGHLFHATLDSMRIRADCDVCRICAAARGQGLQA